MATRGQAGFSLVEIIIAVAISAGLAMLAFVGQRGLRSQAQFDADVDRIVSTIADAHNEATAGVNLGGPGDGSRNCAGVVVPGGKYVFAGVAWSGTDGPVGGTYQMDFYASDRSAVPHVACVFDTRTISVPAAVRINKPPGTGLVRTLFVRNDLGGIYVCGVSSPATNVLLSFIAGNCAAGTTSNIAQILNLSDLDGHTSQLQVDPSGLAKRVN